MDKIRFILLYKDRAQAPQDLLKPLTGTFSDNTLDYQVDLLFKHYKQANTIKILNYNELNNEIEENQIIALRKK